MDQVLPPYKPFQFLIHLQYLQFLNCGSTVAMRCNSHWDLLQVKWCRYILLFGCRYLAVAHRWNPACSTNMGYVCVRGMITESRAAFVLRSKIPMLIVASKPACPERQSRYSLTVTSKLFAVSLRYFMSPPIRCDPNNVTGTIKIISIEIRSPYRYLPVLLKYAEK